MKHLLWIGTLLTMLSASGCVVDPTYTHCNSGDECESGERCFEIETYDAVDPSIVVTAGAFCSEECTGDAQCESNLSFPGVCMTPDGLPEGICFQACEFDSDCFSTSECWDYEDAFGILARVCLPATL